ncbi:MAG TPA: TetR family transcriptional regulator [Actinomycetales bacterium]|nr:TetR family transcriptional regulator [Actinomycetales bacterium]
MNSESAPTTQRRGPRSAGDPAAREAILQAAQVEFDEHGYTGTTLRAVAARAAVDVALVSYYFGAKDNLFRETVGYPIAPKVLVEESLGVPLEELGREMVRQVLTAWGDPGVVTAMRGIVQLKVTNQDNWASLSEFYREIILRPIVDALGGGPEGEYRAAMASTPLIGLVVARYLVEAPAVRDAPIEHLIESVGADVQRWLTGPGPLPPSTATGPG